MTLACTKQSSSTTVVPQDKTTEVVIYLPQRRSRKSGSHRAAFEATSFAELRASKTTVTSISK
eukprot:334210-Rhodomonas_salina.8